MPLPTTQWPAGTVAVDSGREDCAMDLATANVDETLDANDGQQAAPALKPADPRKPADISVQVDDAGQPIPLERLEPKRILGFMPNFRVCLQRRQAASSGMEIQLRRRHPPGH